MALKDMESGKAIALIDEAEMSIDLLLLGLEQLKNSEKTDRLHLPLLLLSNGFERLFKTCLLFNELKERSNLSNVKLWNTGSKGHDIIELHKKIINLKSIRDFSGKSPAEEAEIKFLEENYILHQLLDVLKDFGQSGRYHNFDYIFENRNNLVDPIQKWHTIETDLALDYFNSDREDQVKECDIAKKKAFLKIQETIQTTIGVFSRLIVTGALGVEAQQLSAFFIDYIKWAKPPLEAVD